MVLLTLTNLASVKAYGEFEFWFASIKVAAIIAFICLALAYVLGLTGGDGGVSHLTGEGGFAPEGFGKVLTGVVIVIFAFVGAEIATIAAAESEEPKRGGDQGDELGDRPRARVLRAVRLPDRLPSCRGTARSSASRRSWRRSTSSASRRGRRDERGRAHRRAVVPELRPLRRLADDVRARPPRRRAAVDGPAELARRARAGDPARDVGRLRLGDRRRAVAGDDLPLARELVRRRGAVRVPADRGLASCACGRGSSARTRSGSRSACGATRG